MTHRAAGRQQEQAGVADVVGAPEAAERAGGQPPGDTLRPRLGQARPVDQPRGHGVDPDPTAASSTAAALVWATTAAFAAA